MWVRGLKPGESALKECSNIIASHPVWVRGLKLVYILQKVGLAVVAPRVGAWIETCCSWPTRTETTMSHPVWVRGLKLVYILQKVGLAVVAPRVGAWIETKEAISLYKACICRTPCGCVD